MFGDGKKRCPWGRWDNPLYVAYHDKEWGVPLYDDAKIFEFLVLESAQAGLSWETILKKREGYQRAFAGFNPQKVVQFTQKDVERLVNDASIVRNRAKIEATINNAQRFLEVQKEYGSFSNYIWQFVGGAPIVSNIKKLEDYQSTSPESVALAKDLKNRGFKFLGPTTVYAHMQATGMVNDHAVDCFRYAEVQKLVR